MIKVLSLFFFILFLFYNYTFYNSDTYREKSNNSHEKHKLKLEQYTVKLKKLRQAKISKPLLTIQNILKKNRNSQSFGSLLSK